MSATSVNRIAPWLFAAALAGGTILLPAAGPAPQLLYPSDVTAYLDACHRASLGQWLGRDFSSPVGPAALLPTVLAMKLGGANVNALPHGAALTWLTVGLLAWRIARPRMPAWLAGTFALFAAATAAAPYPLDFGSWRILSYAILYNRLAWVALALAAAATLLPRTNGTASRLVPAGLGAGAVWLWALKPNFLLILLPLVLYHWLAAPARGAWLGRAVLGALGLLLALWVCVRFSPLGYINTHLGMAREAGSNPGSIYGVGRSLLENFWPVVIIAVVWTAALAATTVTPLRRRVGLTLAAIAGCTLVANLTNNQFSEIPLWGALGWLAAAWVVSPAPAARLARWAGIAGVACGLAFTWQPLAAITYAFAWNHYRAPGTPPALEVASPAWRGLPMRPMPGDPFGAAENLESPGNYAAWLNDGLALLAPFHFSGAVLCLDWANPFPFATQTAPAPGDEIAWHLGRTVGPGQHPDATRLLASAGVVMEPLRSIQPASLAFKRELFTPGLQASFTVAAESAHWRVWLRRVPVPPAP